MIFSIMRDNLEHWKNNYPWFADFAQTLRCPNQDCVDYFRNSADYRNRIAYYRFIGIESYIGNLHQFVQQIEKDYEELGNLL